MDSIRDRAKQASSTFYLTLVSVISSLALGYFLTAIDFDRLLGRTLDTTYLFVTTATFQMILLVWHEYVMGTIFFTWVIGYTDSVILFLMGIVQFAAIRVMNANFSNWLLMISGFSLVGLAAYCNQVWKAGHEPENRETFDMIHFHHVMISYTATAVILFFVVSLTVRGNHSNGSWHTIIAVCTNAIFIATAILTTILRRPALRRDQQRARRA